VNSNKSNSKGVSFRKKLFTLKEVPILVEEVRMLIVVFWVVAVCNPVGDFQCYGGKYCLHLQGMIWFSKTFLMTYMGSKSRILQSTYSPM
jgi:hypothetical protein